jgi:hypothetical protein
MIGVNSFRCCTGRTASIVHDERCIVKDRRRNFQWEKEHHDGLMDRPCGRRFRHYYVEWLEEM